MLKEKEAELNANAGALESQRSEITATQEQWRTKVAELQSARTKLESLQQHVGEELNLLSEQQGDLRQNYGSSHDGVADKGLSKLDSAERKSMKRFQKLCRDAKRRVVGA
jgi:sigma54-dependent transcription regulator